MPTTELFTGDNGNIPIACSLDAEATTDRIDTWSELLVGSERRTIANGLRISLGPDALVGDVAALASAEHDCCPFFAFVITIDSRGTALEATAPPEARALLDELLGKAG